MRGPLFVIALGAAMATFGWWVERKHQAAVGPVDPACALMLLGGVIAFLGAAAFGAAVVSG
ncbi:hypothetical protein IPG36_02415 [bacterium]|nr:MAG: hypothetical protein IPG36_02415 [bacterium]